MYQFLFTIINQIFFLSLITSYLINQFLCRRKVLAKFNSCYNMRN